MSQASTVVRVRIVLSLNCRPRPVMETFFKAQALKRAIEAIVAAGGSEPAEARLVADNLVTANLLGHDSHGVGMIPRYIDAVLEGGLLPNQHPKATLDTGTLVALDGCKGYGQSIGREAMQMAIERAKHSGCCIMTLGNSHHLGRIGHWAEMAVAEGLVSIHFVNVISHARVAPHGGRDARFGTNPCCIGVPLPGEPPFLLDYASSARLACSSTGYERAGPLRASIECASRASPSAKCASGVAATASRWTKRPGTRS